MGESYWVYCDSCKHHFSVSNGGGFSFILINCDSCSEINGIDREEVYELMEKYKSSDLDYIKKFQLAAEELAGSCDCGGLFKAGAPQRCPKCKSSSLTRDPDGSSTFYD